ncbi:hypothetical protein V8F20_010916 [Naviculisporaceae sp. PSN 640]
MTEKSRGKDFGALASMLFNNHSSPAGIFTQILFWVMTLLAGGATALLATDTPTTTSTPATARGNVTWALPTPTATAAASPPDQNHTELPIAKKIGIAIGSTMATLLLVAAIVVGWCCWIQPRQARQAAPAPARPAQHPAAPTIRGRTFRMEAFGSGPANLEIIDQDGNSTTHLVGGAAGFGRVDERPSSAGSDSASSLASQFEPFDRDDENAGVGDEVYEMDDMPSRPPAARGRDRDMPSMRLSRISEAPSQEE